MEERIVIRSPDDILRILRSKGVRPDPDVSFKITRAIRGGQSSISVRIILWDPTELRYTTKQLFNPSEYDIIENYYKLLQISVPKAILLSKPTQELPRNAQIVKGLPLTTRERTSTVPSLPVPKLLPQKPKHESFWKVAADIQKRWNYREARALSVDAIRRRKAAERSYK